MIYRDRSAFTTLDNANEGIMKQAEMMEENNRQYISGLEEQLRQANKEIDALKTEVARLRADVPGLHPATVDLVRRFSQALAEKLAIAEKKYGYSDGWRSPDWMDECHEQLMEHIKKGDPRDVAAYCAFLWYHGESTTPAMKDFSTTTKEEQE
jgi:hypothetical protein